MKHIKRPCDECPWRVTATPGRFDPERWEALRRTSTDPLTGENPGLGAPLFACHKTTEGADRVCAGWLAVEGADHVSIRLAVTMGHLPASVLEPGPDWPQLHESFAAAAAHDLEGVTPSQGP